MPRGKRKPNDASTEKPDKKKSRKTTATTAVKALSGNAKSSQTATSESEAAIGSGVEAAIPRGKGLVFKIEHWAVELVDNLRSTLGELTATLNEEVPRRGSFEISLVKADGDVVLLWSGLKKGPPRKLKFPEAEAIADEAKKYLE